MENTVSQPKRIRELDILKGIAIILVIMGHSLLVYPVDFSDIPWAKALRWFIYSFHMPLFFLVAGVVYKCKSYLPYLGKKAQRILIPYAFFGIIEFICASLMSNLVNSKPQPLKDWLVSFFLLGREGWFLQTMFIICAVYPLVDLLLKKPILKLAFAALLIILNLFVKIPDYWALPSVVIYFPYFIIGDVAKDLVKKVDGIDTKKRICFAVCSALLFIASALPAYFLGISFSPLKIVYATAMTSFIFFTASLFHPPLREDMRARRQVSYPLRRELAADIPFPGLRSYGIQNDHLQIHFFPDSDLRAARFADSPELCHCLPYRKAHTDPVLSLRISA